MFTGIIQKIGQIQKKTRLKSGVQFTIRIVKPWKERFAEGESIAINGTCLTVTQFSGKTFTVQAVPETLTTTTLGNLEIGDSVNLERSLRLGDSLGGHFVFGHVDAKGRILKKVKRGKNYLFTIELPKQIQPYLVPKGSVALDGISLTVQSLSQRAFACAVIPHTARVTTLGQKSVGEQVNLEADMMAKQLFHYLKKSKVRSKQ